VQVLLTGRKSKLDNVKLPDLVATVDLRGYREGERTVRLSPQKVGIALPEGVKVESYEPASLSIHLEAPMELQLPVEVRLAGQPASGFEVYSTQSLPGAVRVRGPASHVNSLQRAATEAVSIDGKKDSFNIPRVSINIQDQKVEALDSFVDVSIQIGEKRSANITSQQSEQRQQPSDADGRSKPARPH
jgi:YbbR domain-containing protein